MPCNLRLVRKNGFFNLRADAHHRIQRSHRLLKNHRNLAPPHMPPLLLAQSNKIPPRSCILRRSLRTFVGEELAPPSSLPLNKTSPLTRAPTRNNPITASDNIAFPLPHSPPNPPPPPPPITTATPS